mgnify:CR=1 FL=1
MHVTPTASGRAFDAPFAAPLPTTPREARERLTKLVALLRPSWSEEHQAAVLQVRALNQHLRARPEHATALSAMLTTLLSASSQRSLYAESGILEDERLIGALFRRVANRLLPPAIDEGFLRDALEEVFDDNDFAWLSAVPSEAWVELLNTLAIDSAAFEPARRQCLSELLEAMRLVSLRLAALGTDPTLVRYLPALAKHESPFVTQAEEVREFIDGEPGAESRELAKRHMLVLLEQCLDYVERVRRRSREAGVDVRLIFKLRRIEQFVARMRQLREIAAPPTDSPLAEQRARMVEFALSLIDAQARRNSIRELFSGTVELVARRVTEHASRSGEHYISANRSQFLAMYRAASGAGLIIAFMALNKILLSKLALPLVWAAVAYSLNYGLGFVLIHILGLTIATKQPAMTAATLASTVDAATDRETRLNALTRIAAEVSRTQWISIAGNVSVGFIVALAVALACSAFGVEPVGLDKGDHLLHELDPLRSLALLHAAIAGVYLFLSGLISGYYDNQALYHRVPERLTRVRWLRRILGERYLKGLANYVEHNLGALVGNFLFGCMLGSTAIFGQLLGLPLDIRHVAFAAANLAYGLEALDFGVLWTVIVNCAFGVVCIGAVNLIVSFTLALKVALRSRGLDGAETRSLLRSVGARLLIAPREFFWPPRDDAAAE